MLPEIFPLVKTKSKNFTEYVDDYDNGGQLINQYQHTNISFSPGVVGFAAINLIPIKNAEISFQSKYVSRQFLDNTSNFKRSINPYIIEDIRLAYTLYKKFFKEVNFILQIIMCSIKCMNLTATHTIIFQEENWLLKIIISQWQGLILWPRLI